VRDKCEHTRPSPTRSLRLLFAHVERQAPPNPRVRAQVDTTYDTSDFSIVLWTKGYPHMIQLLHGFSDVPSGPFGQHCFEFTTPSATWVRDEGSVPPEYIALRPTSGSSVTHNQWIMRAVCSKISTTPHPL
jgi:hypothetical protein